MKAHHCHHFYVTSLPGNIMKNSVESKSAEIKILFMVRILKCCLDPSNKMKFLVKYLDKSYILDVSIFLTE